MKKTALLFTFLWFAALLSAQDNSSTSKKISPENIYTSIKPADGQPAVFNTHEELTAKIQDKKDKTILLIKENQTDPAMVKIYREQLWRFENAVVLEVPK